MYDTNIKRIYVSLCNINTAMALRNNVTFDNFSKVVGQKNTNKNAYDANVCYTGMHV